MPGFSYDGFCRRSGRPVAMLVLLLSASAPAAVQAQANEVTLEASILRGAVGYARGVGERTLIGMEAGFGFPQIDRTLVPSQDAETGEPEFEEYLHAALFVRQRVSERFEVDTGLRASIADLWHCSSSDCLPATFAGAYVQPMLGWRRIKLGARVTAGWIAESEEGGPQSKTFTAGLTPLLARVTF